MKFNAIKRKRTGAIGCGVMMLALCIVALPARASYVTTLSNTLSSHATSAAANHTLSFVTRSGAAEGSTILLTFATAFDTSTIGVNDFDFADDGVDLTLAADCLGTEQASVAVASDRATITICTGDGGAIAAGSTVTIEIGTNATSPVVGSSQIVNPSSAGSYAVTIGGTFGDRGSLALAITSPVGVAVSGRVSGTSGGGGGGGGGTGDTAPPIISNLAVTDITETSARVTWDTDEASDSKADYGITASYELGSRTDNALLIAHDVPLSGLNPGTTYHYRARSADLSGNEAVSEDFTFTTLSGPDTIAPTISDVQVLDITGISARLVWATDEQSTSAVDYGLTDVYELGSITDSALVLDHSVSLSGLTSETTYHYRVRSQDSSGNEATSSDRTFRTTDITPPVISAVAIVDITETSARLTWRTNEPATSAAAYGRSASYELGEITDLALSDAHSIVFSGLLPATTYHIQARSADGSGNTASSSDRTFTTLPDTTPPANVSDFAAVEIEPGVARLTWRNPPETDLAGVRIVRRQDRFPNDENDGTVVFDALAEETLDADLVAGTTYRYGAFAYDTSGNFASGALADLTISAVCGDALCTSGEDAVSCPTDCAAPSRSVCGNNVCEADESQESCPADCGVPPTVVCGNNVCEAGESAISCPADCAPPPPSECGNNICETDESPTSCPVDCPTLPILSVCGNQICEADETEESCPADCRVIVIPPPTIGGSEALRFEDLRFLVANQQIQLSPAGTRYAVLQGTVLWVRVDAEAFVRAPAQVRFVLGESAYLLRRENGNYDTAIMTPDALGSVPATLSVLYPDGVSDRIDATVEVRSWGRVLGDRAGVDLPIGEALVSLLERDRTLWQAGPFGQENPVRTRPDGSFAWYAPNGSYRILVRATDYRESRTRITVGENIVRQEIRLIPLPPPLVEFIDALRGGTAQERVVDTGEFVGDVVDYGFRILRNAVLDNPQVEKITERFAAPAVVVAATASAGAAASAVGLLNVLRFLFTQPLVFFARRKRKAWGKVYNAITKVPVDLATVRLFDAVTGRLLQTRVTDRGGRYFFIAQPGKYRIEVRKPHFVFPTKYLAGKKQDALHLDIYHGEPIEVTARDATVAVNIPLDPEVKERLPAEIIRKIVWQKIEHAVSVISPVLALGAVIITPTPLTVGLFVFQAALYGVFAWVIKPKKPAGWGIVYDKENGRPLARAVVRIFEPVYGKLLEMQVTDARGRYSFLVGPNRYKLAGEKSGYAPQTKELDYSNFKEPAVVKEKMGLPPGAEQEPSEEWAEEPV